MLWEMKEGLLRERMNKLIDFRLSYRLLINKRVMAISLTTWYINRPTNT